MERDAAGTLGEPMSEARASFVHMRPEKLLLPAPSVLRITRHEGRTLSFGPIERHFGHAHPSLRSERNGVFGGWRWDGRTLEAYTDRYGMWPVFYAGDAQSILVSDSLVALVGALPSVDLDPEALAVFFRFGSFLDQDTPFRGIRVLPPRGRLRWNGALEITGEAFFPTLERISHAAAVDGYARHFHEAVRRCLEASGEATALFPLSGGRDSRHILLELVRQGARPHAAITIGSAPPVRGSDAAIAAKLTARLRIRHEILVGGEHVGAWERIKNEATHFCADEHGWFAPLFARLGARTRRSWDGLGGDTLAGSPFSSEARVAMVREGRIHDLVTDLLDHVRPYEGSISALERRLGLEDGKGVARRRVALFLDRFSAAPNPLSMFLFWGRAVRELALAPFGLGRTVDRIDAPYLDADLWDFIASLPMELTATKAFHTEVLTRTFPEFADVPFAKTRGIVAQRSLPYVAGETLKQLALLARSGPRHAARGLGFELRRLFNSNSAMGLTYARYVTQLLSLRTSEGRRI